MPHISLVLLYGPDHGLIVERAGALARAVTNGVDDPMQIVRLEGDHLAADPAKLSDEANTISMFGGRRAIRVRASNLRGGTRTLIPAISPVLETPPLDALVIIEAGELRKSDPLVALCTAKKTAVVIPSYGDDARTVSDLLLELARAQGKSVDPDARNLFMSLAGGDRVASRAEVEKLLLYVGDGAAVTANDVLVSVGDTANAMMDTALDGAFGGDIPMMMGALERLKAEGADANQLLLRALAHAWRLLQVIETSRAKGKAIDNWKMISSVFSRRQIIERQLQNWSVVNIMKQVESIGDAIKTARSMQRLADATIDRTFLAIALAARRADRR